MLTRMKALLVYLVFEMFDNSPGSCSIILSEKRNSVRVKNMRRKCSEKGKKKLRKQLREVKKRQHRQRNG